LPITLSDSPSQPAIAQAAPTESAVGAAYAYTGASPPPDTAPSSTRTALYGSPAAIDGSSSASAVLPEGRADTLGRMDGCGKISFRGMNMSLI